MPNLDQLPAESIGRAHTSTLEKDTQADSPRIIRSIRKALAGTGWQMLALLFCFLFGLAMMINNQFAGEATWFWYATLFHRGAKLYADIHLALQPLFILEMNAWMNLFGRKLLVTQIPSLFHLLILCVGLFLLLRESDWPDWQKAIVMVGSLVLWTAGQSYRFDDYHVTTESFVLYSMVLLLYLARADALRRQLVLVVSLGVLCGLTTMSRLNDGVALLGAECLCLLVLPRRRKLLVCVVFVATAAMTAVLILKLTGDSFPDYISNTFTRAVGSKGGAGSFLSYPFLMFRNSFGVRTERRWTFVWLVVIFAAGGLAQRYWKKGVGSIVVLQLAIACVAFASTTRIRQELMLTGSFTQFLILCLTVTSYFVGLVLVARYVMGRMGYGKVEWSDREILILVPLAELVSIAVSAAGTPLSGYYSSLAMLLLLLPVIQPYRKQICWANASFVTAVALLGLTGATAKAYTPYYWNTEQAHPMFVNRQWYRHPVYGPMYIDRDQLKLSQRICTDIQQGGAKPELLSLPFSYPNYFCDTAPWHGYVQTFFDISARSTIEKMNAELESSPPQWIVYQRELYSMHVLEGVFNHGQRFAQHDLDELIMRKIATGEWKLVDEKLDYGHWQVAVRKESVDGESWYVVRTRP